MAVTTHISYYLDSIVCIPLDSCPYRNIQYTMDKEANAAKVVVKRLFTRAINGLANITEKQGSVDIVESRYIEIQKLLSDVRSKHEECISIMDNATEENIADEDTWILEIENRFDEMEEEKIKYCKRVQTAENARKLEEDELMLKINFQKHREEAERTIVQSLRLCKIEERNIARRRKEQLYNPYGCVR